MTPLPRFLLLVGVALMTACTPSSRYHGATGSADRPALPMPGPSVPARKLLDHLSEATFEFPENRRFESTPRGATPQPLTRWKRLSKNGSLTLYRHPIPFDLPSRRYRVPPANLRLSDGNTDLPYVADLDRQAVTREGWVVVDDGIYLATRKDPAGDAFALLHQASTETARRFSFADSGLSPAEFARLDVTIEAETRPCIFLPAPSSATFHLEIPRKGRLRFATGVRAPVDLTEAPGEEVSFEVHINGKRVWRDARDIDDDFTNTEIDLSRWGGETVALSFVTRSEREPGLDLAVFAAPTISASAPSEVRRVVVIGIDTLRPDHLGLSGYARPTSPELDAFARDAFVFEDAWAPAPRTMPSFRTAFTGRNPLPALNGTTFGQVLSREGILTAGFAANIHLVPRFGFNDGFDYWHYENGAKADDQVDRVLAWLKARQDVDTFTFVHIMDPHVYYMAPSRFRNMFVDTRPHPDLPERFTRFEILRLDKNAQLDDATRRFVKARYDGEIRFMSYELGRLFSKLDLLPGRTLVVVHSDHGDELWEHGGFEHNHTLYQELLRVALWVRPPGGFRGGPHRLPGTVGLVDLAPTLYDMLGIPQARWPLMDGRSLLPLMLGGQASEAGAEREAFEERPLHGGYLMYDTERWSVTQGGGQYILQTMNGAEELYDLRTDPNQERNLALERPEALPLWRGRLSEATGWPVGPGWRVDVKTGPRGSIRIHFPVPVREAGVLNPEAGLKNRANLEWGDKPKTAPEDVARVVLSEDRTSLEIDATENRTGSLYILFGELVPEGCTVEAAGRVVSLPLEGGSFRQGTIFLDFKPGTIIVPRDTLGAELQSLHADDAAMAALKALGYVE